MVGLAIFIAGLTDDLRRKRGGGRLLVPLNGLQIVPYILLNKRWLRPARLVAGARPEARRIRSKNLIGQRQLIADKPEFELCVGNHNASSPGIFGGAAIDLKCKVAQPVSQFFADSTGGRFERNILIVTGLSLGRRREDRLRQLIGLTEAGRQRDPAYASVTLIVLPAGSGDIASCHAFHFDHFGAATQHRASLQLLPVGVKLRG